MAATTYTIQFNGNGYTGGSIPPTITKEGTSTSVTMGDISSVIPTKPGYIFRGWSSTKLYSSTRIAFGPTSGGEADRNGVSARQTSPSWTYQNYCDYTGYTESSTTLTLYAQWEADTTVETCTVTISSNNTSQGTVSGGAANVELGTSVTIKATPQPGYIFNYWLSDSGVYQFTSTYTYNATEDAHWTAYFTQDTSTTTYTLTMWGNVYGPDCHTDLSPTKGTHSYAAGTSIPLSVTPQSGYTINGWLYNIGNGWSWITTSGTSTTYTMPSSNVTIAYGGPTSVTPSEYTIQFNANGGSGAPSSETTTGSYTINTTQPTRIGYSFLGWSTSSSATSPSYYPGDSLTVSSNTTLYAIWQSAPEASSSSTNTATINFKGQQRWFYFIPATESSYIIESSNSSGDPYVVLYNSSGTQLDSDDDDSDNGNNFKLIYTLSAGTKYYIKVYHHSNYTGIANITFNITKNSYTITYDANGGSVSPTSQTVTAGSAITTPTATHANGTTSRTINFYANGGTISKSSQTSSATTTYGSNGWYTEGGTKRTNNGGTYTPTQSETLYNHWDIASTGTYSAITFPTGTRTGYKLVGFSTSSSTDPNTNFTGTGYEPGDSTVVSGTDYYAIWKPNNYTYNITYQSTSGVFLGSGTITKQFGDTYSISPNQDFTGYSTPSAKNITWDSTSAKTIVFEYTPINYTIKYVLNGGSASNKTNYNIETTSFTLNNPTKTGNTFKGWSGTGLTGDSNTSVTISKGSTGNKSYEANWTINFYQFTLGSATHVNTTGSTTSGSKQYGSTVTLKATVDAGYTFGGWSSSNTNLIGNQASANVSFSMPAGAITMTPSVSANQYTITYDIASNANSGDTLTNKPSTQTYSYTGGTVTITSTIPKRTGYIFVGWCRSSNSTSNLLSSGATINQTTSNITLYAVWKKDIEITYNINEGIGATPTKQSITIYNKNTGATFSLATNDGFLKQGYKFIGWSTTKNDSSTQVSTSTSFTTSTTLYALWEIQYYNLTTTIYTNSIDSDNGNSISSPTLVSGSIQSGKYAYGSVIKLTATAVDPYDFESWSQNGIDKGSGTLSNNNNKSECNFTITEDTTIIANFATGIISARFYCYDITSGSPVLQTSTTSKVKLWVRSKLASASTYGAWEKKSFSTKMTYSDSTYIQVLIENGEEYEFNSGTGINFAYTIPNQLTDILIQSDQNFSIPCKQIKVENHIKVNDVLKTSGYIKDPYFSLDETISSIWIGDKQIMGLSPSEIYPYKEDSLLIDTLYINNQNTILNKSYQNNTSIKKIIIPKNIITIGANYLRSCTNLKTVKFLQNSQLTSLGNYAFAEDNNLLKIYLPDKLTNIGERAFYQCTRLQKIVLPKTISTIQQYAFCDCANLQQLKLNHTIITELSYSLFMGCSKLKTVFLPKTLTAIEASAFHTCTSLEKIIYMGTIEDWNKITITIQGNTYLNGVPIQCIDGITYTNLE